MICPIGFIVQACLATLEYLFEDCLDATFHGALPSTRKADILSAINESIDPLLQFTYNYLSHAVASARASCGSIAGTKQ